ncbi:threonine ammonia-lyase, biosynthetic [Desulfurella sp.]|uniref:threonine ammonia-lyase, biosynthetic n=1 Tax=Desulfurella sp. TaxID=1962857 RepID=UPI0025C4E857|nr:threonine ammonia-lyase, biosynthetic [Desulfurella sp.]
MDNIVRLVIRSSIYDLAKQTPINYAVNLSKNLNNKILLKREDLQSVFSFKIRGAYNKIKNLSEQEKEKGVICASAGNHAQGVALSAKKLSLKATIVMPKTTPQIKIDAVARYGASIVLEGDSYTDAYNACKVLVQETKMTYIPPFDDELVIAGNATIANEILMQTSSEVDYIFVPIGGGGLIAGIASFIKNINPQIKVIGVQPKDSNAMYLSFHAKKKVDIDEVGIFADGVAVKSVGDLTLDLVLKYVDDIVLVDTDEICSSIKDIYYDTRNIVEPAGALAVAGIKHYIDEHSISKKTFLAINSGANMNFDRLSFVADRALIGEKQEALYVVELEEKPGSFKKFCMDLIDNINVSEFDYRLTNRQKAYVLTGLNINYKQEKDRFLEKAKHLGYNIFDITDNEIAKSHIRYMIGGKTNLAQNEVLYHFSFPERKGALYEFLSKMKSNWNISLFHYKHIGTDYGKVLVGFEIPPDEMQDFKEYLKDLRYPFSEETNNLICKIFL